MSIHKRCKTITFNLTPEQDERLLTLAAAKQQSVADFIRERATDTISPIHYQSQDRHPEIAKKLDELHFHLFQVTAILIRAHLETDARIRKKIDKKVYRAFLLQMDEHVRFIHNQLRLLENMAQLPAVALNTSPFSP